MESVHTHYIEFLNIFEYLKKNNELFKELLPRIIKYYFLEMVTKERCPFLNEEGLCLIYDVRPLVCRVFGHWTKEEYKHNYKNTLNENIHIKKIFKNQYKIDLPKEVVEYRIDYCERFQVDQRIETHQRQSMTDAIFTMESRFFMGGLLEESDLNTGLVSWFVNLILDKEKASELRIQIMREYLENQSSEPLDEIITKTYNA